MNLKRPLKQELRGSRHHRTSVQWETIGQFWKGCEMIRLKFGQFELMGQVDAAEWARLQALIQLWSWYTWGGTRGDANSSRDAGLELSFSRVKPQKHDLP